MSEREFLIYNRRASISQLQFACLFALGLLLACLATFPHRTHQLPFVVGFILVIDTLHFLFSTIIATVLFALASTVRSKRLIVLGTGFFFVALIAVAHALTYPGIFSPSGLLGANTNTPTWLYLVWHTVLPASIIAYAILKQPAGAAPNSHWSPARAIAISLLLSTMAVAGITWLAGAGSAILTESLKLEMTQAFHVACVAILLFVIAPVLLLRGPRSVLDVGLMLMLWALLMEAVLILPGAWRFSTGWYAGRVMGLLSALAVLMMLLIDISRLYGRLTMLLASHQREHANRLMLGEAVGASIAHELRQPLASMMLNASTAQQLGGQGNAQLSAVLADLIRDSRRVNEIVESTRAVFGKESVQRSPADINQLVRDTLAMASRELRNHGVRIDLHLNNYLPPGYVNRPQMQQVFMNLFINAAEAMSEVSGRPRRLLIRSDCNDARLVIQVEDTGSGIPAGHRERIFEAFYTTKKHGTGMGLSICRSVVTAHGGAILVTSKDPYGTVFEINLPTLDVIQPASVPSHPAPRNGEPTLRECSP